jgi:KUP system potassium uptake protein
VRGDSKGMAPWRKQLFLATARVSSDAAEYFHLPRERTVIVGSRVAV